MSVTELEIENRLFRQGHSGSGGSGQEMDSAPSAPTVGGMGADVGEGVDALASAGGESAQTSVDLHHGALFYFREGEDNYQTTSKDSNGGETTGGNTENSPLCLRDTDPVLVSKMEALKTRIRATGVKVRMYTDERHLGSLVKADLMALLNKEYPAQANYSDLVRTNTR